ncbi:hypothetical protein V7183_10080 [Bacillus sp. JJ1127]|uniref:hypothetical protein n=1 Tax=Bacillus sp. JJ1127 TaxID=3122952 RepID=UPI002FFE85B3
MDPKQTALRNKQRERQQRGDDFQAEIRRSWRHIPNVWRMRIADGAGATRPGDEIVLTPEVNILAEMKRTESRRFSLDYMRPNQILGLRDFDQIIGRNLGLVFISFLNESKGLDEAYAFRLLTVLIHMKKRNVNHIKLEEFRNQTVPCVPLPRLTYHEPSYDLSGVLTCYKSL